MVLFVMSWKRSGSTILGNVLGELDGWFHAGELRTLWGLGLQQGRRCGCGLPVGECPFWSDVLAATLDGPSGGRLDPERVRRWQREAIRMRHFPRLLRAGGGNVAAWPALDAYAGAAARLYRAVAERAGARVIVDSSKQQADAALVRLLPGVEARYLHLVRDPRAVAYSWRRRKASPGEGSAEEMMRLGPAASTRNWDLANMAAETMAVRHGRGRSMFVRYEDFVARPRKTVERIVAFAGESSDRLPFSDEHTAVLSANHTAGGNPDRFRVGPVRLRPDDEWTTKQRKADRFVSTTIALPLLHRYGYPLRPVPRRPEADRDRSRSPEAPA